MSDIVVLPWIVLAVALAAFALGYVEGSHSREALVPERTITLDGLTNLSGLAALGDDGLLCVTDEGIAAAIDFDGKVRVRHQNKRLDLEDLAADPAGRGWWFLDERRSELTRRTWPAFEVQETLWLPKLGDASQNHGFEGLCFDREGRPMLAAETHPAGFSAFDPKAKAFGVVQVSGAPSLSAIVRSPEHDEFLLVSRERGLMIVDASGTALTPWRQVDAERVEAAALVEGTGLFLGMDRGRSKLLVFPELKTWNAVKRACLGRE